MGRFSSSKKSDARARLLAGGRGDRLRLDTELGDRLRRRGGGLGLRLIGLRALLFRGG